MKKQSQQARQTKAEPVEQPNPFTPGVTKAMVRQHAFEIYRDKLAHGKLTLEDWVMAEKDLVNSMQAEDISQHPATGTHPEGR